MTSKHERNAKDQLEHSQPNGLRPAAEVLRSITEDDPVSEDNSAVNLLLEGS